MSHSNSPFTPTALPSTSPQPDLTFLITTLQEVTQALLNYSQACKANVPRQSKQQYTQHLDAQSHSPTPLLSNQAKRRECCKDFCYDPTDSRAFIDKEISKFFGQEYKRGNFRGEIHHYYIPSYIVSFEHKLLKKYQ